MSDRHYKSSGRNDFVDLIMSWKVNNKIVGDSMKSTKTGDTKKVSLDVNDDLLVAQCFIFFAAGFETSSTTMSHTLFELAKHQDMQKKVLEEVDAYLALRKNKLDYECILELPYLEAVVDEALRFYPVFGMIPRELMDDYTLPGGVKITKGLRVHLPIHYIHHNPEYFPNPGEFRPERFLGEAKQNIKPYTYFSFGEGPRLCIGMRFAKMQMMAGFVTILKKFRLELAEDMPDTLKFVPQSVVTQPMGGIKLKLIERDGWQNRVFVKTDSI